MIETYEGARVIVEANGLPELGCGGGSTDHSKARAKQIAPLGVRVNKVAPSFSALS